MATPARISPPAPKAASDATGRLQGVDRCPDEGAGDRRLRGRTGRSEGWLHPPFDRRSACGDDRQALRRTARPLARCRRPGGAGRSREMGGIARRRALPPPLRPAVARNRARLRRSEEHTSELQSLMRISYAVFCLKNNKKQHITNTHL